MPLRGEISGQRDLRRPSSRMALAAIRDYTGPGALVKGRDDR
jgi:hypothetical protein